MKERRKTRDSARLKRTERPIDVLPRLVSFFKQEKTYRIHLLKAHWADIVGEAVANHVRPVRMDFRKLFLAADAPIWANELRYMERQIIDKINAFVCDELVTEIAFCTPHSEYFTVRNREEKEKEEKSIIPGREEIETSEFVVAKMKIENDELRENAIRAFSKNLALRRARTEEKWHLCASCDRLVAPEEILCPLCIREKREKERKAIRSLFRCKPWLHIREAADILGCSRILVHWEKEAMLRSLASRVRQADEAGDDAKFLIMLYASIKPEDLTEEIVIKYMARLRFDLLRENEGTDKQIGRKRKGRRKSGSAGEE